MWKDLEKKMIDLNPKLHDSDRKRTNAYCSWKTGIKRLCCPMDGTAQLSYRFNGKGQNKHYANRSAEIINFGLSLKVESAIGKSLSDQAFASSGKVAEILHKVYDVETFITHMFLTSGGPVKHIPAIDAELSFAQEHAEEGSEFDKFICLD
ncbi:hypothetical protein Tco_1196418 [Tanacetum coccineum]